MSNFRRWLCVLRNLVQIIFHEKEKTSIALISTSNTPVLFKANLIIVNQGEGMKAFSYEKEDVHQLIISSLSEPKEQALNAKASRSFE